VRAGRQNKNKNKNKIGQDEFMTNGIKWEE
jgi:hypothetical protein